MTADRVVATAGPLVSILTPSYQQVRWLPDNLDSVERQTYGHIEHIVMDGNSTDGSIGVLESRSRPGLLWRSEPDRGQSDAINKAFAESRGEIVGWLNSDDAYFSTTVVADAVRLFRERPDIDVVYGHAALVNAEGLLLQMVWVPPFRYSLLKRFNFIIQPTALVRRSALGQVLVDESYHYAMDRELWLRLGQSHRLARLDRIIAIDRHQAERKMYSGSDLIAAERRRVSAAYGCPDGPWTRARQKVLKVAFRFAGVTLIRSSERADLAFEGRRDGARRLLVRQTIRPRSAMPMGRPGPSPPADSR